MLYKRKNLWHMDVTVNDVRYREALHTTDRRQAAMLEKKRVSEIEQGKAASKSGREFGRKPFPAAAQMFIEDRLGRVAERTIQFERERLRPLSAYFGEKTLLKIKADDIAGYQKQRLAAGLSGKTINMDIGVLRLMMKRAKCWSVVAEDVKMFPKRARVVGQVLASEQKSKLFQMAGSKPDWLVAHCASVLAVSTTCRSFELKNLRWCHIDLFNRILSIRRSKTDAGHRTIPLNGDATAALARFWERARVENACGSDHFVFPACENGNIDPERPQKSWRSAWRALTKAAGLSGFRFHDLRHQAITEMAEAGATDAIIRALAGHIDPAMMEYYSHVRMVAKRDVLDKLSSGLMEIPFRADGKKPEKID